jgi:hypothetical protein
VVRFTGKTSRNQRLSSAAGFIVVSAVPTWSANQSASRGSFHLRTDASETTLAANPGAAEVAQYDEIDHHHSLRAEPLFSSRACPPQTRSSSYPECQSTDGGQYCVSSIGTIGRSAVETLVFPDIHRYLLQNF